MHCYLNYITTIFLLPHEKCKGRCSHVVLRFDVLRDLRHACLLDQLRNPNPSADSQISRSPGAQSCDSEDKQGQKTSDKHIEQDDRPSDGKTTSGKVINGAGM